jgi:hypothetical protein
MTARRLSRFAGALGALALAVASAADAPTPSVADISDEFDDAASLAGWTSFEPSHGWPDHLRSAKVVDGVLEIEPWTSGWYAEFHAPFLHREVTGDFLVTTRIAANGLTGEIPASTWSLAGLMAREPRAVTPSDWQPRGENWLFITTGIADRAGRPVYETKTTVNSRSNLKLRPAPSGWVELGIARLGPSFFLLVKDHAGQWRVQERFHRMDLPRTLQVGLVAYTDWDSAGALQRDPQRFNTTVLRDGKPDLKARVDWLRHRPLRLPAGVDPRPLTDHAVPEAEILALIAP